jgi:hypothetical protein
MEIIGLIKNLTAPTEFVLTIKTEVKMNKKDVETKTEANPYIGASKIAKVRVILNPDYQKQVNAQRQEENKEADFEASERKWGTSLGNGIIEKNGNLYVSYIHVETLKTNYLFDGEEIEYSKLNPFVPVKKSSGNQGIEKEVQFRVVSVENILDWF